MFRLASASGSRLFSVSQTFGSCHVARRSVSHPTPYYTLHPTRTVLLCLHYHPAADAVPGRQGLTDRVYRCQLAGNHSGVVRPGVDRGGSGLSERFTTCTHPDTPLWLVRYRAAVLWQPYSDLLKAWYAYLGSRGGGV